MESSSEVDPKTQSNPQSLPTFQSSSSIPQPSSASHTSITRSLKRLRKLSDSVSMQKGEENVQDPVFEDEDSDDQLLRERKRIKRKIVHARKRVRDAGKRDRNEKEEAELNELINEPAEPSDVEEEDFSQALGYETLATRYPIVNFETKLYGTGEYTPKRMCHLIHRADNSAAWYKGFRQMLWDFDRTDVLTLRNLVMNRYVQSTPTGIDLDLWGIIEVMFNPRGDDEIWQNQDDWEIVKWELIEQSGIHVLQLSSGMIFYMLTEMKYPLTVTTMVKMLSHKLLAVKGDVLAHDLLKSMSKWIHEENEKENIIGDGTSKGLNP